MMLGWTLIDRPSLLLLDEPLTGIDVEGKGLIHFLLSKISKKWDLTILLITHAIDAFTNEATKMLCLNKEIVYYGPPKKLSADLLRTSLREINFMDISIIFGINFWYALIIGIAVGTVSAYIGSLMLTNQMTLMAGALGHLTLPGIALALRYDFDVSFGALIFLLTGIILIWLLKDRPAYLLRFNSNYFYHLRCRSIPFLAQRQD